MAITPNSTIELFKDVPLNPDQENTLYFRSRAGQEEYFSASSRFLKRYSNNSYQRKGKGTLRVEVANSDFPAIIGANYMRFKNASYENKWFYAFVTKVDYINDVTVELDYQIDVMQTWLVQYGTPAPGVLPLDYKMEQCFVEREHTNDDWYFKNLEPEKLDYGDTYVINGDIVEHNFQKNSLGQPLEMNVGMLAGKNSRGYTVDSSEGSRIQDHVYNPLYFYGLTPGNMTLKLMNYGGTSAPTFDDIVALYMYPAEFQTYDPDPNPSTGTVDTFPPPWNSSLFVTPNLTTIDGYAPKNRKLFNSPYCGVTVSNNNGKINEYKWESWLVNRSGWDTLEGLISVLGQFYLRGTLFPPVTALCYPINYNNEVQAFEESIAIDNFPQCPWVGDTYKAWLAQNKASLVSSLIAGSVSAISGVVTGSLASGLIGGTTVANTLAKIQDAKAKPANVSGQVMTEYLSARMQRYAFTARPFSIRREFAEKLDMYFQMYGYACNRVKVPYFDHRVKWWYIKTIGCDIQGDIPADDKTEICKIFDKGIRFWWEKVEVGKYNVANNVRTS